MRLFCIYLQLMDCHWWGICSGSRIELIIWSWVYIPVEHWDRSMSKSLQIENIKILTNLLQAVKRDWLFNVMESLKLIWYEICVNFLTFSSTIVVVGIKWPELHFNNSLHQLQLHEWGTQIVSKLRTYCGGSGIVNMKTDNIYFYQNITFSVWLQSPMNHINCWQV